MKALQLFSGGLDSFALLDWLNYDGWKVRLFHVSYGQRNRAQEQQAVAAAARFYQCEFDFLYVQDLARLARGSIVTGRGDNKAAAYMPYRNQMLITLAGMAAFDEGITELYTALHTSVYKDSQPQFLKMMNDLLEMEGAKVHAPFITKSKAQVLASQPNAPYQLSWSCYGNGHYHCGFCVACKERQRAFLDAEVEDPTGYAIA